MALDPEISLYVRPPQFTVQTQTPYERQGQLLSLQNLMQQQQMGQLQLEQAQRLAQEQRLMFQELQNPQSATAATPTLANLFAPTQTPVGSVAPVAPVAPAPTTTTAPPPAPAATPGAFVIPPVPGAIGAPTVIPSDLKAPDRYTPEGMPVFQTTVTPGGPTAAAAPGTAPAPAPTPGAAAAPTPSAGIVSPTPQWHWPGGMDPQRLLAKYPLAAPGMLQNYYTALDKGLDATHKQSTAQMDQWDQMARVVQGFTDEPSKTSGIMSGVKNGWITQDQARQLMNVPWNDPSWQGFIKRATDSKEFLSNQIAQTDLAIRQAKEGREAAAFGPDYAKKIEDARQAGLETDRQTLANDASQLAAIYAGADRIQDPTQREAVKDAALNNLPPSRRAYFMNAQTPFDLMQRGLKPHEFIADARQGFSQLLEAGKYNVEYGPGGNLALRGVEPKLRTEATSAAQKAADDYVQANSVADQFQNMLGLARSGNKAAGTNLPVMGVEVINALNGIKRIPQSEINQYAGAGDLWDHLKGKLDKLVFGQPIPQDVLDDMEKMHNVLRQGTESGYKAKLDSINQNYASNFQPVRPPVRAGANVAKALAGAKPGTTHQLTDGSYWFINPDGTPKSVSGPPKQ